MILVTITVMIRTAINIINKYDGNNNSDNSNNHDNNNSK